MPKTFPRVTALDGVSLAVERGGICALRGKIVAGIQPPVEGGALIDGIELIRLTVGRDVHLARETATRCIGDVVLEARGVALLVVSSDPARGTLLIVMTVVCPQSCSTATNLRGAPDPPELGILSGLVVGAVAGQVTGLTVTRRGSPL